MCILYIIIGRDYSSSSEKLVLDPNSARPDLKSLPTGDVRSEENNHYYYNIVLPLYRV